MAFIGNTVQTQGFTPAIDYFSGNASTVTFTLSRPVVSVAQMIVSVANVIQNPASAYTVSGNSITFSSAPPSGTNNIWVEYTSLITTYAAISQSPSVIGDITASGGYLATGNFNNSFIDGTIVDYVTGMGRITAGPADGITLYNGGTSARTSLASWDSNGVLTQTTTTSYGGTKLNAPNGASLSLYQPQSNSGARNWRIVPNWEAWGTLDIQRSVDNATDPTTTQLSINNAGTVVLKGGAISNSGVGVAFPATQVASSDPNTLDDYEEGTWTPTFTNSTTYTQQLGTYVKVGRVVYIQGMFNASVFNNTGATAIQLGGFPFTIDNNGGNSIYPLGNLFPVVGFNFASLNAIMLQGTPNATQANLYYVTASTSANYVNVTSNLFASGQVNAEFSLTYITSA